jgi:hypothetical protein
MYTKNIYTYVHEGCGLHLRIVLIPREQRLSKKVERKKTLEPSQDNKNTEVFKKPTTLHVPWRVPALKILKKCLMYKLQLVHKVLNNMCIQRATVHQE